MRIPLEKVFRVHIEPDGIHLDAIRDVALSKEAEERLHDGIERLGTPERLKKTSLEVFEDDRGVIHVEGFAGAEAR